MSTLQESNNGGLKNLLFLRRCSIDKFKCTAYPILGSVFEKKSSLNHAFQNMLMNLNSRTEKSSPMTFIIIPAMQFLCLTMTSTLNLIRRHVGGASLENLENVLHEFNRHKLMRKRSRSQEKEIKKCNDDVCDTKGKTDAISSEQDEKFYDCLTAPASETTSSADNIKSGRLLKLSYGLCLAVVYTQLTMLLFMVGFCAFKLGFFFLLACVATIAYFVLKMSFMTKHRKVKRHSRVSSTHHIAKAITFCRPIAIVLPQIKLNISKSSSTADKGKQKLL